MSGNLYAHFPFCRNKCAYCSLYSRAGTDRSERDGYARRLAAEITARLGENAHWLSTAYFGGGSPAMCDLRPILKAVTAREFTVELHPLDVTEDRLRELKDGGVNRISMGVQSFDDKTLRAMKRGYSLCEARAAFSLVRRFFDNAGIDLIIGFPGDPCCIEGIADWGLCHCSVYSLQNERHLLGVSDDDWVLDRIRCIADELDAIGLKRYEISNYAAPGCECAHNLAVWRGEDYIGLGEGACGREGLLRTRGISDGQYREERVDADFDRKERALFRLRTIEGLNAAEHPEWLPTLQRFAAEGSLHQLPGGNTFVLTRRGAEICDAILAELV